MTFLDAHEREAMILRFVEQCEYHEISAAQRVPIGTVKISFQLPVVSAQSIVGNFE
jgi:DNA-directed RNA polymerase specialized sigma24 family protein